MSLYRTMRTGFRNFFTMRNSEKERVFFVDDEPAVRKVVGETLGQLGVVVTCYGNGADCLDGLRCKTCDLLITDVKMPDMDGIELLSRAKQLAPWLPVLVVTGYADVPMAVRAVKAGAVDFIQKPIERGSFLDKVRSILRKYPATSSYRGKPLTKTEMKVLKLVYMGKNNKEIAHILGRSLRTVEDHRRNIMRKLDVHNSVELIKRVTELAWFAEQEA